MSPISNEAKDPYTVGPLWPAPRVLVVEPVDDAGLAPLREVAAVDVRLGLSPAELADVIGGYDALVVRSQVKVTADLIAKAPRLKVIGRAGAGVDTIDVAAATAQGVVVVNSAGGNTVAAAEHTLVMIFALARHVAAADASVKRGEWERDAFMGTELAGKTLGIVGLGKIGSHVATVARALGMAVVAHDPVADRGRAAASDIRLGSLDEVLAVADYLTLHVPKTPTTQGMIGAEQFAKAKPGLRLINCARGGVVDEEALVEAIRAGLVAGAALDVFTAEPAINPALRALGDRVVLTPHLGASTVEAQFNVASDVAHQIVAVLAGEDAPNAVALKRPCADRMGEGKEANSVLELQAAI